MTAQEKAAADLMELFMLKWGVQIPRAELNAFIDDTKALMEAMTRAGVAIQDSAYKDSLRKLGVDI